ncbi:hypothetical protein ASF58_24460 [Methylobacterium sp. Leaf125]|nr:hypothetical protein ASF58_24460 [Methylobacterium sp. Leaf125]
MALCSERATEEVHAGSHASIAMLQVGRLAAKAVTASRVMRRRSTTAPFPSNPAKLQVFLPRSIPSTAMGVLIIGPLHLLPTAYRQDIRGGPSHKAFLTRLAEIAQATGGKPIEI